MKILLTDPSTKKKKLIESELIEIAEEVPLGTSVKLKNTDPFYTIVLETPEEIYNIIQKHPCSHRVIGGLGETPVYC